MIRQESGPGTLRHDPVGAARFSAVIETSAERTNKKIASEKPCIDAVLRCKPI